jgi:hypothetical protein
MVCGPKPHRCAILARGMVYFSRAGQNCKAVGNRAIARSGDKDAQQAGPIRSGYGALAGDPLASDSSLDPPDGRALGGKRRPRPGARIAGPGGLERINFLPIRRPNNGIISFNRLKEGHRQDGKAPWEARTVPDQRPQAATDLVRGAERRGVDRAEFKGRRGGVWKVPLPSL